MSNQRSSQRIAQRLPGTIKNLSTEASLSGLIEDLSALGIRVAIAVDHFFINLPEPPANLSLSLTPTPDIPSNPQPSEETLMPPVIPPSEIPSIPSPTGETPSPNPMNSGNPRAFASVGDQLQISFSFFNLEDEEEEVEIKGIVRRVLPEVDHYIPLGIQFQDEKANLKKAVEIWLTLKFEQQRRERESKVPK